MDEDSGARIAGVVVLCLDAALLAALAVLLTPLYLGSVLFPVCLLLAAATNVVLPALGRSVGGSTVGAVAPFVVWVALVLVLSLPRPEGDVLLPGGNGGQTAVSYLVVLVGVVAGMVAIVLSRRYVR